MGVLAILACTSCNSTDSASSAKPSTPAAGTSASAAHTSPTPDAARQKPPATVDAACPLLPVRDLKRLLGGSSHSQVVATEDHSEESNGNSAGHICTYGKPGADHPFVLDVQTHAHPVLSPAQVVDNVAKGAPAPAHPVSGVGQAATFYTQSDGLSFMTAAKRSAGQVRIVIFGAPRIVPEQKFVDVEKLVLSRI
ncbi:hypothetical protein ABT124_37770 [Streptomyces sp. NPDC001982]|uniref:hypothetical protein n=1 Tax=Streptomyces sp. NPDC001982 TaxID=3154405 RepID=UPI00331B5334